MLLKSVQHEEKRRHKMPLRAQYDLMVADAILFKARGKGVCVLAHFEGKSQGLVHTHMRE